MREHAHGDKDKQHVALAVNGFDLDICVRKIKKNICRCYKLKKKMYVIWQNNFKSDKRLFKKQVTTYEYFRRSLFCFCSSRRQPPTASTTDVVRFHVRCVSPTQSSTVVISELSILNES